MNDVRYEFFKSVVNMKQQGEILEVNLNDLQMTEKNLKQCLISYNLLFSDRSFKLLNVANVRHYIIVDSETSKASEKLKEIACCASELDENDSYCINDVDGISQKSIKSMVCNLNQLLGLKVKTKFDDGSLWVSRSNVKKIYHSPVLKDPVESNWLQTKSKFDL